MSRIPAEKKNSASFSAETVILPRLVSPPRARHVTSIFLAILTCERRATPCARILSRIRAMFCSRRPASSTRRRIFEGSKEGSEQKEAKLAKAEIFLGKQRFKPRKGHASDRTGCRRFFASLTKMHLFGRDPNECPVMG